MRHPSLRSKRIRLTLVAALAACSSLVLAAPALAQSAPPPEGHVYGNPTVTMGSASYRVLPDSDGTYGSGRLSANGVINPQGRPGQWMFQVSRFSDFREIGACGTRDGISNGRIEGYDSNDHPLSVSPTGSFSSESMKPECWLVPRVMAMQDTRTLYVRLAYIPVSSGGDDGCAGTPPGAAPDPSADPGSRCYSGTVSVPIPDFNPGGGGGGGSPDRQLITALRGSLAPMGAAAKTGAILKKGFSTAEFNAPSAGSAGVTWRAKKVVVAKGTRTVSRAGQTTIKVKLTKRGKAVLRKAKRARKRLTLKATGSFKPVGGSKVSTSRTIKLKN